MFLVKMILFLEYDSVFGKSIQQGRVDLLQFGDDPMAYAVARDGDVAIGAVHSIGQLVGGGIFADFAGGEGEQRADDVAVALGNGRKALQPRATAEIQQHRLGSVVGVVRRNDVVKVLPDFSKPVVTQLAGHHLH